MGDRFYIQQKEHKPKRVFKKDIILEIDMLIGKTPGLDKLTISSLEKLLKNIKAVL